MKTKYLYLSFAVCVALFLSLFATSIPAGQAANLPTGINPVGPGGDWTMTFNDDFNGTTVDRTLWSSTFPNGGNGEMQQYVSDNSHNNYIMQNGVLQLVARKEPLNGQAYTSGVITTRGTFQQLYGYFEIRAQVPAGMALWPAFWMLADRNPAVPEVDILEFLGQQPTWNLMNIHYLDSSGTIMRNQTIYDGPDFTAGMHVYGWDWEPDGLIWYIDGVERKRFTDPAGIPNVPLYLIANFAVGGYWAGTPDATTVFPAYYSIDYIRAWKRTTPATQPPATTPTAQLNESSAYNLFLSFIQAGRH